MVILDLKISKIEKNIEKGKLIKEYEIEGYVIKKKTKMRFICKTIRFENIVTVSLNINSKAKTIHIEDLNIYNNLQEGCKYSFIIKEVEYRNKNYSYVQIKDTSISENKTFLKSIEHKIGYTTLLVAYLSLFGFIFYKLFNIVFLFF